MKKLTKLSPPPSLWSIENVQWRTMAKTAKIGTNHYGTPDPIQPMEHGPDPNQPTRWAINDRN